MIDPKGEVRYYTTGEIAKCCGVSVRTVQYYDDRGILLPCELSEGGRRLYSEEQVKQLQLICFLRSLDISIQEIGAIMTEDPSGQTLSQVLERQRDTLSREINERREQLTLLDGLCRKLKEGEMLDAVAINDLSVIMTSRKQLRRMRMIMLCLGFLMDAIEITLLLLGFTKGIWWPCIPGLAVLIGLGIFISRYYFRRTAYICPRCHTVFKPGLCAALWAKHTPNTRHLTCTACGAENDCYEVTDSVCKSHN